VPSASKSRQQWNRWANNDGPAGSVLRRSTTTIRSIGRTLDRPRIPWAMSRTDPPTRSYPPLCRVARAEFGTVRCRSPCATKTRRLSGTDRRLSVIVRRLIGSARLETSEACASTRLTSENREAVSFHVTYSVSRKRGICLRCGSSTARPSFVIVSSRRNSVTNIRYSTYDCMQETTAATVLLSTTTAEKHRLGIKNHRVVRKYALENVWRVTLPCGVGC